MLSSDPNTKEKLVQKILDKALFGDIQAAKLIWSYMDGLPAQKTQFDSSLLLIPILNEKGHISLERTENTSLERLNMP